MNRFPNLRLSTWLVAAAVAALAPSCGSDDSPSDPGNKQLCQPGSTQPCTGPAACQGGQSCASDGKSWGSCDCGAAGSGGGGAAGTGGVDASAGGGGVGGSGGSSGASGSSGAGGTQDGGGGTSGSDGAAADAQPPGPLDDPCPGPAPLVDHIDINCSDQCQATDTAKCAAMTSCDVPLSNGATITSSSQLPFTIRLPAKPGLTCACKTGIASQPGPVQYTLWVKLNGSAITQPVWARVGKPWYVVVTTSTLDRCVDDTSTTIKTWRKGCATVPSSGADRWIGVGTNDPNAPSRTLVVRKPWATGTICQDLWQ